MSNVRRRKPSRRLNRICCNYARQRQLQTESLESRLLLASDWHNHSMPLDTNRDTLISPADVLGVINELNAGGSRFLSPLGEGEEGGALPMAIDVNGDGAATPADALAIVNFLNAEGETGPLVRYTLRVFDAAGQNEISSVGLGENYIVRAFIEDIRDPSVAGGVFSAYADVLFDNSLTSVVPDAFMQNPVPDPPFDIVPVTIFHNRSQYGNGPSGTITDGRVDGVGSFAASAVGPGEFFFWDIMFRADAEGTITFDIESTTDANDPFDQGQSPALDTGLFGTNIPVCPSSSLMGCMGEVVYVGDSVSVISDIVAVDDEVTVAEDSPGVTIDALANDIVNNPEGASPVLESFTDPTSGTLTRNEDDTFTYTPDPDFFGSDSFTYTISNGEGATNVGTVSIEVTPVNDPPVLSVPGSQQVDEDVTLAFNGANLISIADADGDISVDVTLAVSNGTLAAQNGAAVVSGSGSSNLSISGAVSAVNASLASLTYDGNLDFSGSDTLSVAVDDGGNVGGGALTDSATIDITINPINDAPEITGAVDQTAVFFIETLEFSAANGNALVVDDVDASTISVSISLDQGGVLMLGSTQDLQVSGDGTDALDISGSPAAITAGLDGAIFTPEDLFVGDTTVSISANDGGQTGAGGAQVTNVSFVIPVVSPRTPFAVSDRLTTDEDTSLEFSASDLTDNDLFPDNLVSLSITAFDADTTAGGTIVRDGDTFTYTPVANFSGRDTFTYTLETDPVGDGASVGTVNITVEAINDAPVLTAPAAASLDEDDSFDFGDTISIADDDGDVDVRVVASVMEGDLEATSGGADVTGNGSGSVTFEGSVSDVNTALQNLTYTPASNFAGSDSLRITVDDLGNTGRGGELVEGTVSLTINPINDPPVVTVPDADGLLLVTDFDNVFSAAEGNAFSVADIDAGSAAIEVELSASFGDLMIDSSIATGSGTSNVTLSGTVDEINAALAGGVTYRTSQAGDVTITMSADDLGNTGAGDETTDSDSISAAVFEFIPSEIGGRVFVDMNNDQEYGEGDRPIAGAEIVLSGTDFRGAEVMLLTTTNSEGRYHFESIRPGNYSLIERQPAFFIDGIDKFQDPVTAAGNDHGSVEIGVLGNVMSLDNDFIEAGLEGRFANGIDLTTLSQPGGPLYNGILFGMAGDEIWSMFLGDAWGGMTDPKLELSADRMSATLTVYDTAAQTERTTVITFASSRLLVRADGEDVVTRVIGSPEDLFAAAAPAAAEGEAGVDAVQAGEEYARAVDNVMGMIA